MARILKASQTEINHRLKGKRPAKLRSRPNAD